MNGKMWEHSATQRNVRQLSADGCRFLGPEEAGMLACGYEGAGRLISVDTILAEVDQLAEDAG